MDTAWPIIRARLAAALPSVVGSTVTVFDGPVVSGNRPQRYLCIGHQPSTGDDDAGSYEQTQSEDGFFATEEGVVLLEAGASTGDTTVPDAFAIASAVTAWVRADQRLGVLSASSTASVAVQVLQPQRKPGAAQRLLISLSYFTRLERTT